MLLVSVLPIEVGGGVRELAVRREPNARHMEVNVL